MIYNCNSRTGRSGAGVANGTRYRYIGDENLVPLENAGGNTGAQASSSANGAKTRSRPNSEYVLYAYGEPVAMSADGDTSYFGTDILGSVRSITDKYGAVKAQYEYDAFGSPYLSNDFDSGAGFGYTGKVYDSATGLYDYGFRDYAPNSARFTTVDPVRDGNNWFSYVVNDPVNYIDPFGLTSTDAGSGSKNSLWINNGDGTYTATKDATLWGLQQETGVDLHLFEGYDGSPNNMPIGTTVTVPKPAGSPAAAVDTGSAIAVTAPSNNGSASTSNGGSFGSAPINGISYFSDSSNMSMTAASTPVVESTGSVTLNGYTSSIFNMEEMKQIQKAFNNTQKCIESLCTDPISPKTIQLAKDYLGLALENQNDLMQYKSCIENISNLAKSYKSLTQLKDGLNMQDPAYAYVTGDGYIYLTSLFRELISGIAYTTPETAIFHEFTHLALKTQDIHDIERDGTKYINLRTNEQRQNFIKEKFSDKYKIRFAQNWEWFFYNYFEE